MRVRRGIGMVGVLLGACMPVVEGKIDTTEEQGTYDTDARADLPLPEGEGSAPFEGSLGPPDEMVEPVSLGEATTTREGSGGPPYGVGEEIEAPGDTGLEEEAAPEEVERTPRRWLHGHDADAW